ncbi:MAG: hypothetical protein WCO71_09405, partial [Pseudomonadota bacterium]
LVAFLAQGLAGLNAGVVELATLADDDGAGTDDEDAFDGGVFGHGEGASAEDGCWEIGDGQVAPAEEAKEQTVTSLAWRGRSVKRSRGAFASMPSSIQSGSQNKKLPANLLATLSAFANHSLSVKPSPRL